jgi:hypothetical protein
VNHHNLSDAERVQRAVYRRPRWVGPIEQQECVRHPGCFEAYRWAWKGSREDVVHGHTEHVHGCTECDRDIDQDTLE